LPIPSQASRQPARIDDPTGIELGNETTLDLQPGRRRSPRIETVETHIWRFGHDHGAAGSLHPRAERIRTIRIGRGGANVTGAVDGEVIPP
jgi:hypothetical protein